MMHLHQVTHTEAAIYWSAVSLIVCEGLSIGAAAERLGIETGRLRNILRRRRRLLAARLRGAVRPPDECH
jgi:DNA-directed RNA polymerase specialized sigma24 family protein